MIKTPRTTTHFIFANNKTHSFTHTRTIYADGRSEEMEAHMQNFSALSGRIWRLGSEKVTATDGTEFTKIHLTLKDLSKGELLRISFNESQFASIARVFCGQMRRYEEKNLIEAIDVTKEALVDQDIVIRAVASKDGKYTNFTVNVGDYLLVGNPVPAEMAKSDKDSATVASKKDKLRIRFGEDEAEKGKEIINEVSKAVYEAFKNGTLAVAPQAPADNSPEATVDIEGGTSAVMDDSEFFGGEDE